MKEIDCKDNLVAEIFMFYMLLKSIGKEANTEFKLWDGRIIRVTQNHEYKPAYVLSGKSAADDSMHAAIITERLLDGESVVINKTSDGELLSMEWSISSE